MRDDQLRMMSLLLQQLHKSDRTYLRIALPQALTTRCVDSRAGVQQPALRVTGFAAEWTTIVFIKLNQRLALGACFVALANGNMTVRQLRFHSPLTRGVERLGASFLL